MSAPPASGTAPKARILFIGPVGGFHVEPMARAVHERGYDIVVAGPAWEGGNASMLLVDGQIPVRVRTWPTARWTRRVLREVQPDVVHAHWMPIAALALLYGASPLVVSAWGSDVFRAGRGQRLASRLVVRYADMVVGSSEALLRELQALGAPPERTMLLNWGVDLDAFSPPQRRREAVRRSLDLPPGPMILSPRSRGAVYNPQVILRAFERVADARDDVTLVLLRSDETAPGSVRHRDRVLALGHVPHDQMADLYRAADVCVSITTSDSSPRSVWEAMACGVPCVVSDIPWTSELIEDEKHALVIPIDDAALARAMNRLLDHGDLAARISAAGRQLVEEHRDRNREMKRLCDLYEQVLRDGGRRSRPTRVLGPAMAAAGTGHAILRRAIARRRGDSGRVSRY